MHLSEFCETKVATATAVNLNTTTKTNLLTIDAGQTFVPTRIIMSNFSGNASAGVANFGCNANADDWMDDVALTNANASGTALDISKIGIKPTAMTPPATAVYDGAKDFGIKMAAAIAFTCDIDVFGYYRAL